MFFKRLNTAVGHIAFFSTFLIVSITLGGLIYLDTFIRGLDYNTSIFDIDFYSLFMGFLIGDKWGVVARGLSIFIIVFITIEFFPKTFQFFLGILNFIYLIILKLLKRIEKPIVFFLAAIFMAFFSFLVVFNWMIFDLGSKMLLLLERAIKAFDQFTQPEQKKIKEKYQMDIAYKDYEKGTFWVLVVLGICFVWLIWLQKFAEVAKENVDGLKAKASTHLIFLQVNGEIKKLEGIFVYKTKNGYLMMMKQDGESNKAVIYSDNLIYKIEKK